MCACKGSAIAVIIVLIYLFMTDFYVLYKNIPYRKVDSTEIRKVMIGLPTIDRDIDKAETMYTHLKDAIDYMRSKKENIEVEIKVITRESDIKAIEFWKDKATIRTIPHYEITKRHNFEKMAEKFNKLCDESRKSEVLIIVESDVYLKRHTIERMIEKLGDNHIVFAYGDIPWAGCPIVVKDSMMTPKVVVGRGVGKLENSVVIGSWTGAIAMRTLVIRECEFKVGKFKGIEGQDIGFFQGAYRKRFRAYMIDSVTHDYR